MEHNPTSEIINAPSSLDKWVEMRDQINGLNRNRAIENQFLAQSKAKKYFDLCHRQREYEIGDLVLAQQGEGRRAKLQSIFQGPYVVEARENDVYTIRHLEGKRELLKRHTSDLRPVCLNQSDIPNSTPEPSTEMPGQVDNPISSPAISTVKPTNQLLILRKKKIL